MTALTEVVCVPFWNLLFIGFFGVLMGGLVIWRVMR